MKERIYYEINEQSASLLPHTSFQTITQRFTG